jgi:predicted kinase
MLIVLSGLPGVGKTTIARESARRLGAFHVRIDSIEQALREAGCAVEGEGYAVGYAVAGDNLRIGRVVIADSVNPWPLTREAWRAVAAEAGVPAVEVEIVCSDLSEHRRRIDERTPDIPGHRLPTWGEVMARDYRAWTTGRIVIDTAGRDVGEGVQAILDALADRTGRS